MKLLDSNPVEVFECKENNITDMSVQELSDLLKIGIPIDDLSKFNKAAIQEVRKCNQDKLKLIVLKQTMIISELVSVVEELIKQ